MNQDNFLVLYNSLCKLDDIEYVSHAVKGSSTVIVFKSKNSKEEFVVGFDNGYARLVLRLIGLLKEIEWREE